MTSTAPHLFLLVDVNPITWGSFSKPSQYVVPPTLPFPSFFDQFCTFLSSYLITGEGSVTVLCCSPHGCLFVPVTTKSRCTPQDIPQIRQQMLQFVREQAEECKKQCKINPRKVSPLAGSLSKTMCCMIIPISSLINLLRSQSTYQKESKILSCY